MFKWWIVDISTLHGKFYRWIILLMGYKCCVPGCTVGSTSNPKPKDVYLYIENPGQLPKFLKICKIFNLCEIRLLISLQRALVHFQKLFQTIFMQVFVFSAPNAQIWKIHPNPPKFRRFEKKIKFLKSPHQYASNDPSITFISYIFPAFC